MSVGVRRKEEVRHEGPDCVQLQGLWLCCSAAQSCLTLCDPLDIRAWLLVP